MPHSGKEDDYGVMDCLSSLDKVDEERIVQFGESGCQVVQLDMKGHIYQGNHYKQVNQGEGIGSW